MKDKNQKDDKIQLSLPLNKRLLKYVFWITLIIAVAYTAVTQPQKIGAVIGGAISLLSPFIIGFCMAYVVNLLLRPLERFWMWIWHKAKRQKLISKTKRPLCLTLSFLVVLGVIFAIVFMIIPALKDTVVSFANKVPQYVKTVESWYYALVDFLEKFYVIQCISRITVNMECKFWVCRAHSLKHIQIPTGHSFKFNALESCINSTVNPFQ